MVGGGGKAADHQVRRRTPIPLESVMKATCVESPDSAYQCCLPASRRRHGHILFMSEVPKARRHLASMVAIDYVYARACGWLMNSLL